MKTFDVSQININFGNSKLYAQVKTYQKSSTIFEPVSQN